MRKQNSFLPIILIVILALCCCLILILGALGLGVYQWGKLLPTLSALPPNVATPTPFEITRQPYDPSDLTTLTVLQEAIVPQRNLALLACRYKAICDAPETLPPPAIPYTIGSQRQFWVLNEDDGSDDRITATLQYLREHVYFWVEEGVSFNQTEAENLIDTFEEQIYPTNREFFGSEWTPGIDNDPHIYIIYARDLGDMIAGFYISLDEYNPLIVERSNGIEAFYIDSSQDLGDEYTYGTIAHEFQHMIHWNQDANESSFLDEGFAELATFLNGYDTGGFDWYYTSDPDIALTDWRDSGENNAHYGANFLFVTYFLDRFGEEATQALVHDQRGEFDSIDNVLATLGITDPLTQDPITADDYFLDWTIANYVHSAEVSDGRYVYSNYPDSPTTSDTEWVSDCTGDSLTRTVNQYGVDYIRFNCQGNYEINFSGATLTRLLPEDPHSGEYAFWSQKSNDSYASLTRQFDFSSVTGPLTLTYWTWYDIEPDFDYAYLAASLDGENWEILITPSGTGSDPNLSSYGWGYTALSGGWIQETVDLSQYAGQMLTLRFDYITDAAVINQGFLLDDLAIPEINYTEDFESDDGGWQSAGFVRIQNLLPQGFRLALIHHTTSGTTVEILPIQVDQVWQIPISLAAGEDVVLVVTATTRYTSELAPYQIDLR